MTSLQHKPQPSLVLGSTVGGNKLVTLTGIDFERHKVLSGISGSGKSTFIAWIAVSLLRQSIPFIIIDPHGSLAKLILSLLASSDYFRNPKAYDRLWYVDFKRAEKDAAIAFNILKQPSVNTHTISSNFLEAMHRAFPTSGTTTSLDNVIEAACYVLAETNQPVTQLSRLLLDATFREMLLKKISHPDPLILQFFKSKFEGKASSQLIDSTLRRSFLLTFSPVLRNILSQQNNKIDYTHILNNRISCLFSLGGLDDSTKRLIACMLLVSLEQKFLSMTDIHSDKKSPLHLIVDEAPVFFSQSESSFTNMLEQAR
ncbi:MAG TPA: ATP-binding protein, partial [Methylomirabilota bacterium]|nr:ATP-binding protein [Methylomirabilota bacterium]